MAEKRHLLYGNLNIIFFILLAGYHIYNGQSYHILWTCHMASLFVGLGLILRSSFLNGIGFLWLCFGVPLWILNVLSGDELVVLSVPTHIGGILFSLWGLTKFGLARTTWVWAGVLLVALGHLSRFITPPFANVNLSHAVWRGYEEYFSSHLKYVIFVYSISIFSFYLISFFSTKILNKYYIYEKSSF